ncbi:MAG: hypothetical protein KDA37_09110 [Planctomycetales bacterium]|nr:hypothetical protein [Planctomycetales bacterium]
MKSCMYRAPGDGEYWFAIRTMDDQGRSWPQGPRTAELKVVVDTELPTITIQSATLSSDGRLDVEATVSDPNIDPSSISVACQNPSTGIWAPLSLSTPLTAGRQVSVRASAALPPGVGSVSVRVTARDSAGNPASAGRIAVAPAGVTRNIHSFPVSAHPGAGVAPPPDPYTVSSAAAPLTSPPAWQPTPPSAPAQASELWPPDNQPLAQVGPQAQRPYESAPREPFRFASKSPLAGLPLSGATPSDRQTLLVNSDRFELQYELQSVGRWGVSRVEVWGTDDGGATWRSFAIDADQRSPVNVQTPGDGLYGFTVVVQSVGGLEREPPRPGDKPDVYVQVDHTQPVATLLDVTQPQGYFADHLIFNWAASDTNLAEQPVSLLYAAQPSGPWLPVATNLPNAGRYSWRLQRHVPSRVWFRLEVRDRAGNVGVDQSRTPVEVQLNESSGQIRNIRPLE